MARITDIALLQQAEQPALVIETTTDMANISQTICDGLMKIRDYVSEQGETPADIPFVTYPNYESMDEHNIRMIIGFKLAKPLPDNGEIKAIILPAQKNVSCIHRGGYAELAQMYGEMAEWIKTNGYKASGTSTEYYHTTPATPENELVTRVEMPLK